MSSKTYPTAKSLLNILNECDQTYKDGSFKQVRVYFGCMPSLLLKNKFRFFKDDCVLTLPHDNDTLIAILSDMSMSNIVIQELRFNTHWIEKESIRLFIFVDESDDFQTNIEWDFIDGLLKLGNKYNSMMR